MTGTYPPSWRGDPAVVDEAGLRFILLPSNRFKVPGVGGQGGGRATAARQTTAETHLSRSDCGFVLELLGQEGG